MSMTTSYGMPYPSRPNTGGYCGTGQCGTVSYEQAPGHPQTNVFAPECRTGKVIVYPTKTDIYSPKQVYDTVRVYPEQKIYMPRNQYNDYTVRPVTVQNYQPQNQYYSYDLGTQYNYQNYGQPSYGGGYGSYSQPSTGGYGNTQSYNQNTYVGANYGGQTTSW